VCYMLHLLCLLFSRQNPASAVDHVWCSLDLTQKTAAIAEAILVSILRSLLGLLDELRHLQSPLDERSEHLQYVRRKLLQTLFLSVTDVP